MNAGQFGRRRTRGNNREGPPVIGEERVSVRRAVVEILIVHVAVKDRDGALFAKLEAGVWRDVITLRAVVRSDCGAVVLAGVNASDVEPATYDIDRLTEINSNSCVVRCVGTVIDRVSAGHPWTKLDNRRGASWIR